MLVKFDSNVAGEMLMFADVARRLLTLAGKECTARGVITREQIPEIVARLRRDGRFVEVIGYNDASADIIDRFALHDKTGVELGAVPH